MAIPSLSGISSVPQTGIADASSKLEAVLAEIVSGNANQTAQDVASVSIATQLQSQTSALTEVSGNLTQGLSLTQVASGAIGQIQDVLAQQVELASQAASPVLSADNRKQINQQFQQLSSEIDSLAGTTSFNGENVLDGSLSGANALSLNNLLGQPAASGDSTLSIPNLSSNSLLGSLDISTSQGASQALAALSGAQNQITGTQASVGAFQQTLDFASANVDSAAINLQAAQSSIGGTDFAEASTQASTAEIQFNAAIAIAAQANNLNPALLQLVG